ncbi:MAG TPA: 2-amino-4-hydroxy-6-hydroxymethyldihydropteridine diphosphokinase [Prolixibacteraceae bacterium]|jgi:2-amino-4-hydroxy-6-hydroxymethyldihydropteridine diphosphokinase|nr:2-amino-4-hydroxy-6-hydroxymethyldihydropteridine diphosphokinase [Bacteroidales bacterium]HPJ78487.1 2-amino-4-hydroxy-6-hydroxymethyldihydropteridine diphosphokinase [Prolixibacteraceae bacterium]HRV89958.1 2-amino-4-hydroxy-6-hydroxymethyldihydropteridine diphosphokinase [Prolixibacteraceae bacterium]
MNQAIIGIGSNIRPEENIPLALRLLGETVTIEKVSALVTTSPIGLPNQPDFVNGAARVKTSLSRHELEQLLKKIEDLTGRDRTQPRFGPRTIDLDLVMWNGQITDPDYYTRTFLRTAVREVTG